MCDVAEINDRNLRNVDQTRCQQRFYFSFSRYSIIWKFYLIFLTKFKINILKTKK